jgi:UDP-N-acetylmuramate dehydrogenase
VVSGSLPGRLDQALEELLESFAGTVVHNKPLGPLTSFRLGGPAAIFVEPADEADLERAGLVARRHEIPILIMGKGSNVLVADAGFPGVVIRMGKKFEWIRQGSSPERVEAGGAATLPQVSNWAAKRSLTGMEFAVAIPATVGGGVAMNAGAHGSSVSQVLESVRICTLAEGQTEEVQAAELDMSYRRTKLGPGSLVCSAQFLLEAGDPAWILGQMKEHRKHRAATQPSEAPNAGSMFKNPPEGSAGGLIESAGLKGSQVGAAEVSTKHGNFFLARPGATAQDVYNLMAAVQRAVEENLGVTLVPEVKLIGDFDLTAGLKTSG